MTDDLRARQRASFAALLDAEGDEGQGPTQSPISDHQLSDGSWLRWAWPDNVFADAAEPPLKADTASRHYTADPCSRCSVQDRLYRVTVANLDTDESDSLTIASDGPQAAVDVIIRHAEMFIALERDVSLFEALGNHLLLQTLGALA